MKFLKLCLRCRRKLSPQRRGLVGAWYCEHCRWAYTQAEVEEFEGNRPGAKLHVIKRRRKADE